MKFGRPAFLILLLAMLFCGQYAPIERARFPEWTQAERQAVTRAIKHHGNFTAHRTAEGTYLKTERGMVWIERREGKAYDKR